MLASAILITMNRHPTHALPRVLFLLLLCWLLAGSGQAGNGAEVALSTEELQWIAEHPVIRVANEDDWPPYDFSENGVPSGYSIDLLKLVAEKVGLQLEFINGYSWDELLQMGRDGKLDLFPAIWRTTERETFLSFTRAYAESPHILLIREEDNRIHAIQDLNGRTLAGITGYADVETVKAHYPDISVLEVSSISEGLRAVAYGHADAYLGTLGAVSHALREEQITGLRVLGETTLEGRLEAGRMHFAVRQELSPLTAILQKGLDAVSREERMAIQNRWLFTAITPHGEANAELGIAPHLNWAAAIAAAAAVLSLLLVILLPRLISDERLARYIGTLRFRAFVISALAVTVVLVLLAVEHTLQQHRRQIMETTQNELRIVLEMAMERIEDWEQEQKRYLTQLGRDAELVALTRQLLALPSDTDNLLRSSQLAALRSFFELRAGEFGSNGFFIIDPRGITVGARGDGSVGTQNLIVRHYPELFGRALAGEAVFVPPVEPDHPLTESEQAVANGEESSGMFFAVPVTAPDGRILAVLTQGLRPEGHLSELMKYGRIGQSGESYIVDRHGHMVTSSRFREQLIEVGLLARNERVHGRLAVRDPGGNLLSGYRPSLAREQMPLTRMAQALLREAGTQDYVSSHQHMEAASSDMSGYRDYRGVPVFGAWVWNPHLGLGMTTEIDIEEALAVYHTLRRNLFAITGLILLLALVAVVTTLVLSSRATKVLKRSHDALEQQVAERTAALAESEEKYRRLFEFSQDPMWLIVGERFVMANGAAARLLGYDSTDELVNVHPSNLSPERQLDGQRSDARASEMMATAYREGYHRFEWLHRKRGGEPFPVEVSLTRIPYEGEDALFCIWRDISEQKANEEGLKRATAEAQQANRAKSEFLSSMSHELRTPLNAILGFSQLLELEENLSADQQESVHDIMRAGSHLLELINEVLDLAKIEAGKMELSIEPIDLRELMAASEKLIVPTAEKFGIELHFGSGCHDNHTLAADYTRSKQVLLNLLSNAIKYNRPSGSVEVRCRREGNAVRIEVHDTGPGIPADKRGKLFTAFDRLGAEGSNIEGTGIGLVITRQLVVMMGGEMGVESVEGEGSTFWFTLPCAEEVPPAERVAESVARGKVSTLATTRPGNATRVLYIEDNPANLKLVELVIAKRTSAQLLSAMEPEQGLVLARTERPELILLDINLPGMDGYEVLRRLRAMPETASIPVIALTANAMNEQVGRGDEAGFDGYLTKPLDVNAFLGLLQHYLGE